ncbi:MAG: tRNA pseudouridine(38-40) synthase TruA [SAR202 cluster bacterium]|nr:tRNA pseudouridine(38-40) synthase TruA [SAR202 cluster bacterium]
MRLALVIEYDGTGYHGFQYQENAPSVQEELEAAIERLTGVRPRIKGAGRTDAGVHAAGQVAAFDTESALPPETFVRGMNHYLPDDIAVRAAHRVADDFDPRRHALARAYRYTVLNLATRSPLTRRRALQVEEPLDVAAMNEAAQAFVGVHNFARFSGPLEREEASTVRQVFAASVRRGEYPSPFGPSAEGPKASPARGEEEVDTPLTPSTSLGQALVPTPVGTGLTPFDLAQGRLEGRGNDFGGGGPGAAARAKGEDEAHPSDGAPQDGTIISIDFEGNAFLPHQVRRMAGALVDVGKRRLATDDIMGMLEGRPDGPVANTLPPQGLCLMEVRYGGFPPTRNEERNDASKKLQPTGVRT